jgi:hypothetical protein
MTFEVVAPHLQIPLCNGDERHKPKIPSFCSINEHRSVDENDQNRYMESQDRQFAMRTYFYQCGQGGGAMSKLTLTITAMMMLAETALSPVMAAEQKVTLMLGGKFCDAYLGEVSDALTKIDGVRNVDLKRPCDRDDRRRQNQGGESREGCERRQG